MILFVNEQYKDENGRALGFVNFGEVEYLNHKNNQPMDITCQLKSPMPSELWQRAGMLGVKCRNRIICIFSIQGTIPVNLTFLNRKISWRTKKYIYLIRKISGRI